MTRTIMYAFHGTLGVSERISEDCSSSECAYRNRTCPRVSHYLLSLPDSSIKLSTELASPRVHLDTTAHHALIIGSVRKAKLQPETRTPPRAYVSPYATNYTKLRCPFSVCKGYAGSTNIAHLDILCDHVPDLNIDGFRAFP